jgi:tRNA pseudouridine38-40 synthase
VFQHDPVCNPANKIQNCSSSSFQKTKSNVFVAVKKIRSLLLDPSRLAVCHHLPSRTYHPSSIISTIMDHTNKKHGRGGNDGSRGRQQQQQSGGGGGGNRKFHSSKPKNNNNNANKKARTEKKNSRISGTSWRDDDSASKIHPGSYAHEAQRQRFQVELEGNTAATSDAGTTSTTPGTTTTVKRKVAMLLGYRGTDYGGFQINEGVRTIQGELELAMYSTGLIRHENFGIPQKYGWSTSGRTDRGVHAAAQTVSCKIELPAPAPGPTAVGEEMDSEKTAAPDAVKDAAGDDDASAAAATKGGGENDEATKKLPVPAVSVVVSDDALELARQRLNAALPAAITVMSIIRTTRGFCAHTQRDKVRYQYLLPSFMIDPLTQARLDSIVPTVATTTTTTPAAPRDTKDPLLPHELAALRAYAQTVRSTRAQREALQSVLQQYVGTHPFHNFTKGVASHDARANRYILAFDVHEPVVDVASQTEWIPTTVTGQSFLIHQIRKMIGAAMEIVRGKVPNDYIQTAFSSSSLVPVPIAPATGLFLEQSWYEGYNNRKNQAANLNNTNMVEVPDLDWSRPGPVLERWQECVASLQKHIIHEEQEQGNFWQYLFVQERVFSKHYRHGDFTDPTAASTVDMVTNSTTAETVLGEETNAPANVEVAAAAT